MMRYLLLALLIGSLALTSLRASEPTFILRAVGGPDDAAQCFKDGGRAALVADLAPNGDLTSAFATNCLLPSK